MSQVTGLGTIQPQTFYRFSKPEARPYTVVAMDPEHGDFGPFTPGTQSGGIQEAINATPPGQKILIRAGTYQMTNPNIPITVSNPLIIEGEPGTVILSKVGVPSAQFLVNHTTDVVVRNIVFDGGGVNYAGPTVVASEHITFEHITARNCYDRNIWVWMGPYSSTPSGLPMNDKIVFRNCLIGPKAGPIDTNPAFDFDVFTNGVVENCFFEGLTTPAGYFLLQLWSGSPPGPNDRATVANCTFENHYSEGIMITLTNNVTVTGCKFYNILTEPGVHIKFGLCDNVVVENCIFENCKWGIAADSGFLKRGTFANNIFESCPDSGIALGVVDTAVVTGNIFHKSGGAGLGVGGSPLQYVAIAHNIFSENDQVGSPLGGGNMAALALYGTPTITNIIATDNVFFDGQATPTQLYGIAVVDGQLTNCVIEQNVFNNVQAIFTTVSGGSIGLNKIERNVGYVKAPTSPLISGLASGVAYQNFYTQDIVLLIPVTLSPTSTAGASASIAVGSSPSSLSTVQTVSAPAGATPTQQALQAAVPAGQYWQITLTNATVGPTIVLPGV